MRRVLLAIWLLVFCACFVEVTQAQNTQLSGTLSAPGGAQFNGYMYLSLTQDASGLSSCSGGPTLVLPNTPLQIAIVNGAMVNAPKVWGADCLNPQAPYNVVIKDNQGNTLSSDQWLISGANFNIGTATSTNSSTLQVCGGAFACIVAPNTFIGGQTVNGTGGLTALYAFSNQGVHLSDINAAGQLELPSTVGCPTNTPTAGALSYDSSAQELCLYTLSGWGHTGGGGGGSGTVTSVAATSPLVASPGPIINTGTLSCPTCVIASSPGLGIAHFAGSTQAVTSSLVDLTADVTNNLPLTNIAAIAANTVLGSGAGSVPTALSMPDCSASNNALTWALGSGFGCHTVSGGGGGGSTPGTTGIAFWDNTIPGWGTSYGTSGTGLTVVLNNSPTITTPTIIGGASFTGTTNGNISLTSVGTAPSTAAANTLLLTVPNSVTAYTITFPGAVPVNNGVVASTSTSGNQNWVPLPALTTISAGNCFDSYDNSTGTFGTTACSGGGSNSGTLVNIQNAYPGGTLGAKLLACLADATVLAKYVCDATTAVEADSAINGTAWSINTGKITISIQNNVPVGDTVYVIFGSTSALTGDYTTVAGTTGTAIVANTGSGLVSGTELVTVYPTLGATPIEIARNFIQIVKWPPAGYVYAEETSTTIAAPPNPTVTATTGTGNLPASTYYYQGWYQTGNSNGAVSTEQTVTLGSTGELVVTAPSCPQYAIGYTWALATSSGAERVQANIACGGTYNFAQAALFPETPVTPSGATSVPAIIMYNRNHPQMYAESGNNGGFTIRTTAAFVGSDIIAMGGKGYSTLNNVGAVNYGHAAGVLASIYDGGVFFGSQRMNVGAGGAGGTSGTPTVGYWIEGVANDFTYYNLNTGCQDSFCTPLFIQKVPSIDGDGEGGGRLLFDGGTAQSISSSTSPLVVMQGINSNSLTTAPWNGGGLGEMTFVDFSMEGTNPSSCMTMTDVARIKVINGHCQSNSYSGSGTTKAFVISSTGALSPDATYLTNSIDIDAATMGFNTIYQNNINSFSQTVANNFYPWTEPYHYGGGQHSIENWNSKVLISDSAATFNGLTDSALTTGKLVGTTTGGLFQAITLGTGLSFSGSTLNASGGGISALTGDVTASGSGSVAATVVKINGTSLAGLATGLLKNTTGTGVPSIASAGTDYLTPTGSATGLSKASSSAFGVAECDNTTITCSGGIMTAVGGGGSVSFSALTAGIVTAVGKFPGGDLFYGGVNSSSGGTYTVLASDENKLLYLGNGSGTVAVTLAQATTTGFTAGAVFHVLNSGTGVVTITPTTSTINGASSLALVGNQSAIISSDGTNYFAELGDAGTGACSSNCVINNPAGTQTITYSAAGDFVIDFDPSFGAQGLSITGNSPVIGVSDTVVGAAFNWQAADSAGSFGLTRTLRFSASLDSSFNDQVFQVYSAASNSPVINMNPNGGYGWNGNSQSGGTYAPADTVLWRIGSAIVGVGGGTPGSMVGGFEAAFFIPGEIFNAATLAIPSCGSALKGWSAVVSDATTPTYMTAYTSGGAITSAVICSFNSITSTYSWLTH